MVSSEIPCSSVQASRLAASSSMPSTSVRKHWRTRCFRATFDATVFPFPVNLTASPGARSRYPSSTREAMVASTAALPVSSAAAISCDVACCLPFSVIVRIASR